MNDTEKLQADACPVCGRKKEPSVPWWAKLAGGLVILIGAVLAVSVAVWLIALIWRHI